MFKKLGLLLLVVLSVTSCVSTKEIHYFNDTTSSDSTGVSGKNFETRIKPDDQLLIIVSAPDPLAAEPFNLPLAATMNPAFGTLDQVNVQAKFQTYLVDRDGNIEFPVLGVQKIGGLTKQEVLAMLHKQLLKYINTPIINLRILNYKVSVFGEVVRPGVYSIAGERITIPEALSMAGDLTIYGQRKDITLMRDVNGVKTYYQIDLTKSDLVNSPYFYLQQNDVIYVKQNKVRTNSAAIGPNTTVIISAVSLLLTTIALLTR